MTIDTRDLDAIRQRYDLLTHSFYTRWVAGELSRDELDDYAGQYAHVVAGLPRWLEAAAETDPAHAAELRAHAREESTHVRMWDEFARALRPDREIVDAPNAAAVALLETCDRLCAEGQGAAVAWALEAQSPEVSATKLRGLAQYYGIDADGGGRYFALHAERDVDHRDQLVEVLDGPGAAPAAEQVLAGLWGLLSSVDRSATSV
jgi:pyrroloquinoline-quinone synthase